MVAWRSMVVPPMSSEIQDKIKLVNVLEHLYLHDRVESHILATESAAVSSCPVKRRVLTSECTGYGRHCRTVSID